MILGEIKQPLGLQLPKIKLDIGPTFADFLTNIPGYNECFKNLAIKAPFNGDEYRKLKQLRADPASYSGKLQEYEIIREFINAPFAVLVGMEMRVWESTKLKSKDSWFWPSYVTVGDEIYRVHKNDNDDYEYKEVMAVDAEDYMPSTPFKNSTLTSIYAFIRQCEFNGATKTIDKYKNENITVASLVLYK